MSAMKFAQNTLVLMLLAITATGCQTMDKEWSMSKSWNKLWNPDPKEMKSQYQTPARLVALWAPAMYTAPGKQATRGFGGRLYFYNDKDQPIPVEGQLIVYAFNDSNPHSDGRRADRKFVFTSQQLASHFSPAELGASYSIWIPWDAVNGPQVELSLLPVFSASSGQVVMAEQSRNLLPGTVTPSANSQQQSVVQPIIIDHRIAQASFASPADLGTGQGGEVAQASHMASAPPAYGAPTGEGDGVRMTSITLTRGLAERLVRERLQEGAAPSSGATPASGAMPASGTAGPGYGPPASPVPQLPIQQPPPGVSTFNAPTAQSRSWGPTVPRMQATTSYQSPIGQSPTRYAPGQLPAPMTGGLQPASGQPPMQPAPGGQPHLLPSPAQSSPYPLTQASWQSGPAGGY
jgi:hypothetical protein